MLSLALAVARSLVSPLRKAQKLCSGEVQHLSTARLEGYGPHPMDLIYYIYELKPSALSP